jgi:hypothetical protein
LQDLLEFSEYNLKTVDSDAISMEGKMEMFGFLSYFTAFLHGFSTENEI